MIHIVNNIITITLEIYLCILYYLYYRGTTIKSLSYFCYLFFTLIIIVNNGNNLLFCCYFRFSPIFYPFTRIKLPN